MSLCIPPAACKISYNKNLTGLQYKNDLRNLDSIPVAIRGARRNVLKYRYHGLLKIEDNQTFYHTARKLDGNICVSVCLRDFMLALQRDSMGNVFYL